VNLAALVMMLSLCGAVPAHAQSAQSSMPSSAAPQPSQQQLAMGYFAGPWKITGTSKISPNSPPAPYHATATGEWIPGNFFLQIKYVTHGPLGDIHMVRMMEYNPGDNVYTYNEYNSLGEHVVAIGRIDGKSWVWNTTKKLNGVITKGRYITTFVSPDSYSIQSQVQKPSGGWVTITEATATRMPQQQGQ
jgi:Protein of unknown function (DUF1579)